MSALVESAPGEGVSALGGGGLVWGVYSGGVSQHALRQTPCEQNDRQVQKYYLGHNFVAAGNNFLSILDFLFALLQGPKCHADL